MGEGFQFFDILILAAVALFGVLRLRSVLGKRTGFQEPKKPPIFGGQQKPDEGQHVPDSHDNSHDTGPDKSDNVVHLPDRGRRDPGEGSTTTGPAALSRLQQQDPYFNQQDFLNGARMAFEMIVEAYSKGDQESLRPLLSPDVFRNFIQAIESREKTVEIDETTLIGIQNAEIVDASIEGRTAYVTVKFLSEEVSVVRNAAGDVLSGDPSKVIEVVDLWTFARNLEAADPNWQLVATESPE